MNFDFKNGVRISVLNQIYKSGYKAWVRRPKHPFDTSSSILFFDLNIYDVVTIANRAAKIDKASVVNKDDLSPIANPINGNEILEVNILMEYLNGL